MRSPSSIEPPKCLDPLLDRLVHVVTGSDGLEDLVRPLLELLEAVTGLESTYLTNIDDEQSVQRILYARNTRKLAIPEGLSVPWGDTLCKRALEEGRNYVTDVASCWGDSDAARALGIKTYLSVPVKVADGELYGTLCGASDEDVTVTADAQRLLGMFARLIARQIDRDRLLAQLKYENQIVNQYALSDPLTGMPNRRALTMELTRALANARRTATFLYIAFIDLDGFKRINDSYGHDAGDRFLIKIAASLTAALREGDFAARLGGDEFVMFGQIKGEDHAGICEVIRQRLLAATIGRFDIGVETVDYAGASVGVITATADKEDCESLISRADAAMYEAKQLRIRTANTA